MVSFHNFGSTICHILTHSKNRRMPFSNHHLHSITTTHNIFSFSINPISDCYLVSAMQSRCLVLVFCVMCLCQEWQWSTMTKWGKLFENGAILKSIISQIQQAWVVDLLWQGSISTQVFNHVWNIKFQFSGRWRSKRGQTRKGSHDTRRLDGSDQQARRSWEGHGQASRLVHQG